MSETITQLDKMLVVKIGTTVMFRHEDGRELLDHASFERIGGQVLQLRDEGYNVSLVSPGAVTAGMESTGTTERPKGDEAMPEIQRLATLGWHHVVTAWERALGDVRVGGILVTRRELNPKTPEHDEILRTAYTLLSHKNVPAFNENDGVTHGELANESFEQNDELAALFVTQVFHSDLFTKNVDLVLLSDVDGFLADVNDPGSLIREVSMADIDKYAHLAGGPIGVNSKGGMASKLQAAKIVTGMGRELWIANGRAENAIQRARAGEIGTHFTPY